MHMELRLYARQILICVSRQRVHVYVYERKQISHNNKIDKILEKKTQNAPEAKSEMKSF